MNEYLRIQDTTLYKCDKDAKGEIVIPEGIKSIHLGAFKNCKEITKVVMPSTLVEIKGGAFAFCEKLTRMELPDNVETIRRGAFTGCTGLTSINIPKKASLDDAIFDGCTNLENIEVEDDNENYCVENGLLLSKDKTYLYACFRSETGKVVLPESVVGIGDSAFESCPSIQSIDIPEGLKYLGFCAFSNCKELREIHLKVKHPRQIKYGEDIWYGTMPSKMMLFVPEGKEVEYRGHRIFKKFKNIVEEDTTEHNGLENYNFIWGKTLDGHIFVLDGFRVESYAKYKVRKGRGKSKECLDIIFKSGNEISVFNEGGEGSEYTVEEDINRCMATYSDIQADRHAIELLKCHRLDGSDFYFDGNAVECHVQYTDENGVKCVELLFASGKTVVVLDGKGNDFEAVTVAVDECICRYF